jgi:16S rRNA (uracil1498-N3)-methyltransferase
VLPVFVADPLPVVGGYVLDGPEGRHAAGVRRLRRGERLLLTDGRGGLATCEVTGQAGRDALALRVLGVGAQPEPALRVVLAQALVKGDRGELAVELATEAGVDVVLPWRAARCVVQWEGERGARSLQRWRGTAREAAKQARRAWLPEVDEPVGTPALAERARSCAAAVVLHESATTALADVPLPSAGELLLVVGPEGGVDDAELAELAAAGAVAARLGPSVLRASTAAAVALGALGVLTRRWDVPGITPIE